MRNWERWLLPLGLVLIALFRLPGSWVPFQNGKWALLYAFSFFCLAGLFLQKPVFPELKRSQALGLGAVLFLMLAHLFYTHPTGYEFSLLDRLCFFVLLLSAWRGFSSGALRWRDFWWPLAGALGVVSFYGLWQVFEVGFTGQMAYTGLGSTFGYANNAAQFVGLTLLVWWCIPRRITQASTVALYAVSTTSLTYLVFSRGRSALIAFGVGAIVAGYMRYGVGQKLKRKALLPVVGVALAVVVALVTIQVWKGKSAGEIATFSIFAEKAGMVFYRADVWRQTIQMIKAIPLGVGLDRFSFEFIPFFREGSNLSYTHLAVSPHNEFLRFPAEEGLPLAALYLAAWIIFGILWWRKGAPHREIVLPAGAFFLVEMAVQFPWQNSYPFYVGAMLGGAMLAGVSDRKAVPHHAWARATLGVAVIFFGVLVARGVSSRVLETSKDLTFAKISCRAAPANWQACLNYSRLLLEGGEKMEARREVEAVWEREPNNYTAIRHLGVIAGREGVMLESCFLLWKYDDTFKDASDLHGVYLRNCPEKWRDYFKRKRPKRFHAR